MVARRQDLVAALSACTEKSFRAKARRFLDGLSADELEFIAEFLGCSILRRAEGCPSRAQVSERIAEFQLTRIAGSPHPRPDDDHKMILLFEFLCRSGLADLQLPKTRTSAA